MARRRLLLRLRRRRTRQRTSRCRESRTCRSSAPGSGSPPTQTPHLHRDRAGPCRICPSTGLSTSARRYCTARHWHAKQGGARFQPPILSLLQMPCPRRIFGGASPNPGADAVRGEPESWCSCGGVSPFLEQLNSGCAQSPPQMWQRRAPSRCRCGGGEHSLRRGHGKHEIGLCADEVRGEPNPDAAVAG